MADIPVLQYGLSMIISIVFLLFLIDYMRNNLKVTTILWFGTILTFPLMILSGGVVGWFRWAKTLSVLFPILIFNLTRLGHYDNKSGKFWDIIKSQKFQWFYYGILFLNIMEATIKDVGLGNYFNALCGFLLCVTIPYGSRFWKVTEEKPYDIVAYTTVGWNFIYTTWNACFVFGESPKGFLGSLCILIAAELYPIIKKRPELYIISRVYTLGFILLVKGIFPTLIPRFMDGTPLYNTNVLYYWGLINFILIVPYVFWHTWQLDTGKCEYSFRRKKNKELQLLESKLH